jgi:secondary thiamine-phosphate synthase enzyme
MHFSTNHGGEFWDISDMVRGVVARSGVGHGQVTVHTPHTTTSIILNESETGFLNDYRHIIETVVPVEGYYEHDDHELRTENLQEDEFINGHSHVRQMMIGSASITVPVVDGQVLLGTWQKVLYVELDQARERKVIVHAQGV